MLDQILKESIINEYHTYITRASHDCMTIFPGDLKDIDVSDIQILKICYLPETDYYPELGYNSLEPYYMQIMISDRDYSRLLKEIYDVEE